MVQVACLNNDKWRVLADQFIDRGLVRVGEHYVLYITEFGQRILDGEPFLGQAPASGRRTSMSSRVSARGELQYDAELFEKLRTLRKSIADEANLPPTRSSTTARCARWPPSRPPRSTNSAKFAA